MSDSTPPPPTLVSQDKYAGCFLGLAIGDAGGAPFEGGTVERLLWKLIGRTRNGKQRYTDDTQMSIDIATSFLANGCIDQHHLAETFADSYRWSRGYGPSASHLLRDIRKGGDWRTLNKARFKEGSYGNGAAMRAPIVTLCFPDDLATLTEEIVCASEITHAHPLAIEGAKLISCVTYAALHDWSTEDILNHLPGWSKQPRYQDKIAVCRQAMRAQTLLSDSDVRKELGHGMAATDSCVSAIYFALSHRDHEMAGMQDRIHRIGGDTDTIAAMAGAIWGAFNGKNALSRLDIQNLEDSEYILELATKLCTIQPLPNSRSL